MQWPQQRNSNFRQNAGRQHGKAGNRSRRRFRPMCTQLPVLSIPTGKRHGRLTRFSRESRSRITTSMRQAQRACAAGCLEIHHCREGRIAYPYGDACFFLAPGDLAIVQRAAEAVPVRFPTGHYHGITVTIDPARAPDCLSCFLEDVEVRPSALIEKFCADGACFVTRSSPGVAHIFSELYSVPEGIRKGYFKVKILELLLFLSAFPIQAAQPQHGYSLSQVQLAEQIGAYLLQNTERRLTVAELSRYFGASATLINSSFRGVYGMSPAAFLRAQKMHGAARLLRRTDRTVLDIAGQFGYDNGSKFAKAFRDVIGVSPNAYRSGIDCDSCAPEAPML